MAFKAVTAQGWVKGVETWQAGAEGAREGYRLINFAWLGGFLPTTSKQTDAPKTLTLLQASPYFLSSDVYSKSQYQKVSSKFPVVSGTSSRL